MKARSEVPVRRVSTCQQSADIDVVLASVGAMSIFMLRARACKGATEVMGQSASEWVRETEGQAKI